MLELGAIATLVALLLIAGYIWACVRPYPGPPGDARNTPGELSDDHNYRK
jgi:hypothetical protein